MIDIGEWKCKVDYDIMMNSHVVTWYRHTRETAEHVEIYGGQTVVVATPHGMLADRTNLPRLSDGMLAALAAELNPGPTEREMAHVQTALDIERARVDRVLAEVIQLREAQ